MSRRTDQLTPQGGARRPRDTAPGRSVGLVRRAGQVKDCKVRFVWHKDRSCHRTVKARNRVDTSLLELLEEHSCAVADIDEVRWVEVFQGEVGDGTCRSARIHPVVILAELCHRSFTLGVVIDRHPLTRPLSLRRSTDRCRMPPRRRERSEGTRPQLSG